MHKCTDKNRLIKEISGGLTFIPGLLRKLRGLPFRLLRDCRCFGHRKKAVAFLQQLDAFLRAPLRTYCFPEDVERVLHIQRIGVETRV